MKKISIAYFGTPYFSARFLEKLLTDTTINRLIEVRLIVTQPDQLVGRKQTLTKTPVKIVAEKFGIKVWTPTTIHSTPEVENVDVAFLFAYGEIIPNNILRIPRYGFLNTHPSLLPKYRGPGPIVYPLILGDKKTGTTLIRLDEEIDHGPVMAQREIKIHPKDRRPDLELKLTDLAFEMFKRVILNSFQDLDSGQAKMTLKPQNHSHATYTRQLEKSDGFIPFSTLKKDIIGERLTEKEIPSIIKEYYSKNNLAMKQLNNEAIYNLFRGLFPWPGIWTKVNIKGQEKRLKITDMDLTNNKLILKKVQLEGKKEVNFKIFNSAYKVF